MEISIRNMVLKLFRNDGTTQEKPTTIIGDDDHVQWVAEQYADVNHCGVTISNEQGTVIGMAGNIQS